MLLRFTVLLALCAGLSLSLKAQTCVQTAEISLAFSGDTELSLCEEAPLEPIRFQVTPFAQAFAYVVVDANDVIQYIDFSNFIDFNSLPAGNLDVYAFSTYGRITASVGEAFSTATLSTPCFGLTTNSVRVRNGGGADISITSALPEYNVCLSEGRNDTIEVAATLPEATFVITDETGLILGLNTTGSITFSGAEPGICRIYASTGLDLLVGDNVNDIEVGGGCGSGISENFIIANRLEASTGLVSTETGKTDILVCPEDPDFGTLQLDSTGTTLDNFVYLITDENNMLLRASLSDQVNLNLLPDGTCRIYGLGFSGGFVPLPGAILGEDDLGGCSAISENFVTVRKENPVAGEVSINDGSRLAVFCTMDGIADLVTLRVNGQSGGEVAYVLTTDAGEILAVQTSPEFDFDSAPFGTCYLYTMTYQGELLPSTGLQLVDAALASSCFEVSPEFVTIVRTDAIPGTIATDTGETEVSTCPGDGQADVVTFNIVSDGSLPQVAIITDTNNVVIATTTAENFDFEEAPVGTCRIWGLTFAGDLMVVAGQDLDDGNLAEGCFALTNDFITVNREVPEAGDVSLASGDQLIDVCAGGQDGGLVFATTATSSQYAYLITQGGIIIAFTTAAEYDPSGLATGTYEVFGLAYAGNLTVSEGQTTGDADLADGCFDLTTSSVTLNVTQVDGGAILGNGLETLYFCTSNTDDGVVTFTSSSTLQADNFFYVVTTATGEPVVLEVLPGNTFDFGAVSLEEVRVYAISFTGTTSVTIGFPITLLPLADGCFTLSENFVTIFNGEPAAGTLSAENVPSTGVFCSSPGDEIVNISVDNNGIGAYAVVTLDAAENIIAISEAPFDLDIASFGEGDYRVIGVSYSGSFQASLGDNAVGLVYADNCFDVTADTLNISYGGDIDAGTISFLGVAGDSTGFCIANGDNPVVVVENSINSNPYQYIVTDENGRILRSPFTSGVIPFLGQPTGTYRIYGFAFTGLRTVQIGQLITGALSTQCFAVSSNFLLLTIEDPDGGMITTATGETDIEVTLSGGPEETTITFITDSDSLTDYRLVVTDTNNMIIGLPDADEVDFSGAVAGTCRVWGLAFTGALGLSVGDVLDPNNLGEGCRELSENFVTVERLTSGLTVSTDDQNADAGFRLTASPNPVRGTQLTLSLRADRNLPVGDLVIIDLQGRQIASLPVENQGRETSVQIDVSTYPPGMYVAVYVTPAGRVFARFIKD